MTEGEVWKLNAERNAKIEAERPQSESMDIYSEIGTRIVYMGKGGWPGQTDEANKCLSIGGTYTVNDINVSGFSSKVELLEVPNKRFNTVMFRNV